MNLIAFPRSAGSPGRRGITILEVLIAAGVLAIGMFGVMAMIPLIAMRLREGEIADRSAVLSRNAVEEIQVRGWTDPRRWRWYRLSDSAYVDPTTMAVTYAGAPGVPLGELDWPAWSANYLPVANPTGPNPALVANLPASQAICVDPQGLTGIVGTNDRRIRFPYRPLADNDLYVMHRVTPFPLTTSGAPNNDIDKGIAEVGAVAEDDLLFERPESRMDLPMQTFPTSGNELANAGVAFVDYPEDQTRRMAQRDYSYMATLTPLDDNNATDVNRFTGRGNYLLSAIVFYQRSRVYEASEHVGWIDNDSTAGYGFRSAGISGGDVAISRRGAADPDVEILNVSKGDWVMLTYPALLNGSGDQVLPAYHRWYQVIEAAPYDSVLEPNYRFVTLAGPDWPYVDDPATAAVEWPSDTQVTWLPGVASVSEKTITLGSGGAWE